jgi:hypothetical protein
MLTLRTCRGQKKWLMRMRGAKAVEDEPGQWKICKYDDTQHQVSFEVGDDGNIKFCAVKSPGWRGGVVGCWEASKIGYEPKGVGDPGVISQWERFQFEEKLPRGQWIYVPAGCSYSDSDDSD